MVRYKSKAEVSLGCPGKGRDKPRPPSHTFILCDLTIPV